MYLSVIIPTFNGADTLAEQLEALANQISSEPFEVIISDNGSTDASRTIAERYLGKVPGLRMVDSSDRRGRSHARNAGAEAAVGRALAFTDQDDVVGEGWVRAMETALENWDFVTGPMEITRLNKPWRTQRAAYPKHEPYVHKYPPYLAHAPATNLGVKRSLHQSIGGFDESFMLAWEDSDYGFRIQLAGTQLHFVPDAVVHYRLRHDLVGIYRQARAYGEGNVVFYKKYEPMARVDESWKTRIREWTRLFGVRTILGLRKKSNLVFWLCQLGWRIGHFRGCVKHRVLAPSYWM